MSTRCRAHNPKRCRNHGGRMVNGFPAPVGWRGRQIPVPKKVASGHKYKTRQIHGFRNEFYTCEKYDLLKMDKYTDPWDAYTRVDDMPVSMKTVKHRSEIPLADFGRNKKINQDFYFIVAFWSGEKHNVIEEITLRVPYSFWKEQFVDDCDEDISMMLKNSSPERSYDLQWHEDCDNLQSKWLKTSNSIIRLRPKRDHKGNVRMQCAISYNDFMALREKYQVDSVPCGSNANLSLQRMKF